MPPGPIQVRETLEELGPAFVKLGQVLSTRSDLVPPEYLLELEKLQDNAPHVPFPQICKVIEEEFGVPVETVFKEFNEIPLAAASLGQTHQAVLLDGRHSVVKVQRPEIRAAIETDIEIVSGVARLLDRYVEQVRLYDLPAFADEFAITIRQEMDYTREGHNGDVLKKSLSGVPYVKTAETIWDYSTSRVLTAEDISGVKITDMAALEAHGYNRHEVAGNLWKTYLKMIFVDGFFQADPHPGNLVVLENNVIGLLDYGMIGRLDKELKNQLTMLLENFVEENSSGFADVLIAIGTTPPDLERKQFAIEIDRLLRQYYGAPVGEIRMGEWLSRAIRLCAKRKIMLPPNLGLLVKVLMGVEGIDFVLDPTYNMFSEALPFIESSVKHEFSYELLRRHIFDNILNWKTLITSLPRRTSQVLDRMADGSFRIVFKHEGLDAPTKDIDRSANRLSLAVISSATLVSSALVLSSKVGPIWKGYPVLGIIGFGIAFVFGMWLIISIIRAGNLW